MPTLTSQTRFNAEETRLADANEEIDAAPTFEQIVCLHQDAVARLAQRLVGWRDRDAVEDIVQEVFVVALRKIGTFRGDSSIRTWLLGITVNQCRAHRRREMVRLRWLRERFRPQMHTAEPGDENVSKQVRNALGNMRPRDREVIVLFYLESLPIAQIAPLLGIKPNAVEVRLHRARQRLKVELAGLMEG